MPEIKTTDSKAESALDDLVNREEVLQICFWRQGEGFGDVHNTMALTPFIHCNPDAIAKALEALSGDGLLEYVESKKGYKLTETGYEQGGHLFSDAFSDSQRQGHGECPAGCCDGDDHSQCGDDCMYH